MSGFHWQCPRCPNHYHTDNVLLPVKCRCGLVDRIGEHATYLPDYQPTKPSKARAVGNAMSAMARWYAAGCPVRTDAEVLEIHDQHCVPCKYFKDGTCRKCSCRVRTPKQEMESIVGRFVSRGMANKIRMATEHCPIGKW